MVTEAAPRQTTPTDFSIELGKVPIGNILEFLYGVADDPRVPAPLSASLRAVAWMLKVESFRQLEEGFLLDGTYEQRFDEHRVILSHLIADGEAIVGVAKNTGMSGQLEKFSLGDVEATLESLHRTFRGEYGPKNSDETNTLIKRLFDGPKP